MTTVRTLSVGDEERLEHFLQAHADSSMFLRSNARVAGLVDRGERYQATYVAMEADGRIIAVVAHAWNGMVLVQAPVHLDVLVRAAVTRSGRPITGLCGPDTQVTAARRVLGLADSPAQME